jgi:transcriptional regulator with XRE-family HTH domain
MRSQRRTSIIVVGGTLAIASVAYGLGTQAGDGTAVADSQSGERGARLMVERGGPCGASGLADELGVEESKLEQALRDFKDDMRVDFAKELADALGISTSKVTAALDKLHESREQGFRDRFEKHFDREKGPGDMPPPPARMGFHFGVPSGQLASELGVTRSELRKALGEVEKKAADRFKQHNRALAEFLADRLGLDVDKVLKALPAARPVPGPPLMSPHLPDHPPAP